MDDFISYTIPGVTKIPNKVIIGPTTYIYLCPECHWIWTSKKIEDDMTCLKCYLFRIVLNDQVFHTN